VFHGNLYEFFRNDVLNANSFFNNRNLTPRPPLRYNDFGGTFGGPVFIPGHYNSDKKKTFFFFSEEVRRVITYKEFDPILPSQANVAGNFRTLVCVHHDPNSGNCNQTSNTISAAQFNPDKLAWLNQQYIKAAPDARLAALVRNDRRISGRVCGRSAFIESRAVRSQRVCLRGSTVVTESAQIRVDARNISRLRRERCAGSILDQVEPIRSKRTVDVRIGRSADIVSDDCILET